MPRAQTCCGQPAYNAATSRAPGRSPSSTIAAFEGLDYVVAPSGSCAGDAQAALSPRSWPATRTPRPRARAFAERVHELVSFLVDVRGMSQCRAPSRGASPITTAARVCASSAIRQQPRAAARRRCRPRAGRDGRARRLLRLRRAVLGQVPRHLQCHRRDARRRHVAATAAELLLSGDLGCLHEHCRQTVARRDRRSPAAMSPRCSPAR